MTEKEQFLDLVRTIFPAEPIPTTFFRRQHRSSDNNDINQELMKRIFGRSWKAVTIMDWAMIDTSPAVSGFYLDHQAFIYHVASILT